MQGTNNDSSEPSQKGTLSFRKHNINIVSSTKAALTKITSKKGKTANAKRSSRKEQSQKKRRRINTRNHGPNLRKIISSFPSDNLELDDVKDKDTSDVNSNKDDRKTSPLHYEPPFDDNSEKENLVDKRSKLDSSSPKEPSKKSKIDSAEVLRTRQSIPAASTKTFGSNDGDLLTCDMDTISSRPITKYPIVVVEGKKENSDSGRDDSKAGKCSNQIYLVQKPQDTMKEKNVELNGSVITKSCSKSDLQDRLSANDSARSDQHKKDTPCQNDIAVERNNTANIECNNITKNGVNSRTCINIDTTKQKKLIDPEETETESESEDFNDVKSILSCSNKKEEKRTTKFQLNEKSIQLVNIKTNSVVPDIHSNEKGEKSTAKSQVNANPIQLPSVKANSAGPDISKTKNEIIICESNHIVVDEETRRQIFGKEEEKDRNQEELLFQASGNDGKKTTRQKKRQPRKNKAKLPDFKINKCSFCVSCSCSKSKAAMAKLWQETKQDERISQPLSNADKECILGKRLVRAEKGAAFFNTVCTKMNKELKDIRRRMKQIDKGTQVNKSWFLKDIDKDDESVVPCAILPKITVQKAVNKTYVFRRSKSAFFSCFFFALSNLLFNTVETFGFVLLVERQPTLTQMLGDDEEEQEIGPNDVCISQHISQTGLEAINEEESESELDTNKLKCVDKGNDSNSDFFVDYEIASSKGKDRTFWSLSNLSQTKFHETKRLDSEQIMPLEETDFEKGDRYFEYRDEISAILSMSKNTDGLEVLTDYLHEQLTPKDDQNVVLSSNNEGVEDEDIEQHCNTATLSQLSQGGREIVGQMTSEVFSNDEKKAGIESICPNWNENMIFALQQSPEDTQDALFNVQEKRAKLKAAQDLIIQASQKMDSVLELFESSLSKSIHRHNIKPLESKSPSL